MQLWEEQLSAACKAGLTIVRVSFDNECNPIFLGSKELLDDREYIAFVETITQYESKNYSIVHWMKEK